MTAPESQPTMPAPNQLPEHQGSRPLSSREQLPTAEESAMMAAQAAAAQAAEPPPATEPSPVAQTTVQAYVPAANSFNVFSYGAKGDGISVDTEAIQRTIDAAAASGTNAVVEIPPGFSFVVGTLKLPGNLDFNLDGILLASTNQADYSGDSVLSASNAPNLQISGTGTLNGQSLSFMTNYDAPNEWWLFAPWRPKMFMLTGCTNLIVRDLSFGDAPYWGLHMLGCHDVLVTNLTVRNRLNVPNCDGIDADHCQQVEICNCDVIAGDDAIVVKNTRQTTDFGPCAYIHVHDCLLQTQDSGVKIGTETCSDVHDVLFENCRIASASRGLTIQLRDEGSVSNVVFRQLHFFARYFSYPWWGRGEGISLTAIPRTPTTKLGTMQNILIQDVTGQCENSIRINGTPESHIRDVRLVNVAVTIDRITKYPGGGYDNRPTKVYEPIEAHLTSGFNLRYADGVILSNCTLKWGSHLQVYYSSALETDHVTGLQLSDFKGTSAHPDRYGDMMFH